MDWSDIGRIVAHGDRDWLVEQVANGHLVRCEYGLYLKRVKGRVTADIRSPRIAKCVFHDGSSGCTIAATRRPATCNFYVCESAFEEGEKSGTAREVASARKVHDDLVTMFVGWDAELAQRIRTNWPEGPPYDAAFFDWLGEAFVELRSRR